jgi:hypothetical protein
MWTCGIDMATQQPIPARPSSHCSERAARKLTALAHWPPPAADARLQGFLPPQQQRQRNRPLASVIAASAR